MEVLKGMQQKMTAKYQRICLSSKPALKTFGLKPEEKDKLDNQEYKYSKHDNKERVNLRYLTNRKKKLNLAEKLFEYCFSPAEEPDPDDEKETAGNIKIIDMLIFSPDSTLY
jgi:hypothetical protein